MSDSNTLIGVFITLIIVGGLVAMVAKHRKKGTHTGESYRDHNPPPGHQKEK